MDNSFSIIEAFVRGLINAERTGIVEVGSGFSFTEYFGKGELSIDSLDCGMYLYIYLRPDEFFGRFTPVIMNSPTYFTFDCDVICLIKIK